MSFSRRLREERKRLRLTQKQLASMLGITEQAQIAYEKDRLPQFAEYLEGIARAGADVSYVITGERGGVQLTDEEAAFLSLFRRQDEQVRAAALEVLKKGMVLSVQQVIVSGNVGRGGQGHQTNIVNGKSR